MRRKEYHGQEGGRREQHLEIWGKPFVKPARSGPNTFSSSSKLKQLSGLQLLIYENMKISIPSPPSKGCLEVICQK